MPIRRKLIDDLRGFLNTMPLSDMIMLGIAESVENIRSLLRYLEGRADELDFLFDHGPSTIVSSIRGYINEYQRSFDSSEAQDDRLSLPHIALINQINSVVAIATVEQGTEEEKSPDIIMRSVNEIIYDNNISTIINDNNLLFGSKVPFGSKIPLLDNFNINDIKFDIKFIGQYFISIEDSYISV